jgi:CheY-like chemotaxis protein
MVSSSNHGSRKALPDDELKGVNILLVEDSWHIGEALKDLLQRMGATVAGPVASTGEASRLLTVHSFHVALVDYRLRGDDLAGNLIRHLNELGVSVVVISGCEALPVSAGCVAAFLRKPFTEEQLLAALQPLRARASQS